MLKASICRLASHLTVPTIFHAATDFNEMIQAHTLLLKGNHDDELPREVVTHLES